MKRLFVLRRDVLDRIVCTILIIVFLNFIQGCMFYYRVETLAPPESKDVAWEILNGKYMILHAGNNVWYIENPTIDSAHLSGIIRPLPANHMMYMKTNPEKANKFIRRNHPDQKKPYEGDVLNEVHLYTNDTLINISQNASIDLSSLGKMEIYYYSKSKSRATWYSAGIGVPLVIAGVAVIIALLTSCPLVYTYDGNTWTFVGEIYAGAVYPSLERDDYMILPGFQASDGKYRLKISNELKEKQNTNLAELMMFRHSANSEVIIDKNGNIQTILHDQLPSVAVAPDNRNFIQNVSYKDQIFYSFDAIGQKSSVSSLVLAFENHEKAGKAKLVVNAKNSLWADYSYGKFTELFGTYYNKWNEQQKKISPDRQREKALNQDIPLSVYLETENGWEFIDYYNVVGPMGARDMVMPIDLTKVKSNTVRIKLETGFMFWELDYAAIDFSENLLTEMTILKPELAVDEKGNDVAGLIRADDELYLKQYETGLETIADYNIPDEWLNNEPGFKTTVILHSKGYYEYIRSHDNHPDWIQLTALNHPHSFSKFSLKQFKKFVEENNLTELK